LADDDSGESSPNSLDIKNAQVGVEGGGAGREAR
jgi:hypothetical protein